MPEEGVVVPVAQLDPVMLRNLVIEFVTREWSEYGWCHATAQRRNGKL